MRSASDSARRARPLVGTFVEITASGAPRTHLHVAIERAFQVVADVHRLMSFHEPESDVSRLNRDASTRPVRVHPWTYEVLRFTCELHAASAGLFDVAVADVLQHLGLLPPLEADRQSVAISTPGSPLVELLPRHCVRFSHPGVGIDLGGIAKGFAVDRALEILRASGTPRGLVNAGGDLAAFGPEAFTVHIRDPRHPLRTLLEVEVSNEALASSGGAFDPFRSLDATDMAVIDPRTRRPARTIHGATVRAPSCVVADALTKFVIIAGESVAPLLAQYDASAMFVPREGDLFVTRTWPEGVRPAS